jgi:hypothetical protein
MLQKIFFLFLVLLVQEPVSSTAAVLSAYLQGIPVLLIHITYISATIVDIFIGYYIGNYFYRKTTPSRFVSYLSHKARLFVSMKYVKKYPRTMLFTWGSIIFPITALIIPFLGISFFESFIILMAGQLLFWYSGIWLLVLGMDTFFNGNLQIACVVFFVVVLISMKLISSFLVKNNLVQE